jgi:hypothetical protein
MQTKGIRESTYIKDDDDDDYLDKNNKRGVLKEIYSLHMKRRLHLIKHKKNNYKNN